MPNNGIFSLSNYYDKDVSGDIPEKSRETFREYGYFGGGNPSPSLSIVSRIDYSNDTNTASIRGPLSLARFFLAATGNNNFGYFGGGQNGPVRYSTIDRIDYSNDTATASTRGPLSLARGTLSAVGNKNFGWFITGDISRVDRIDYANDLTTASIRRNELANFSRFSSFGNSNYGWNGGGNNSVFANPTSLIRRIDYSNDLIAPSIRGPFNNSMRLFGATGNSNFGYAGGNYLTGSAILRVNYTNDLVQTTVRGVLSAGKSYLTATGDSNFGYFGGGFTSILLSTVDRIDYSNDTTTASIRGPLFGENRNLAATSSASFGGSPISQYGVFAKPFGYFGGGFPNTSAIDRIDYANDTSQITTRNNLSLIRYSLSATGNSNFGYFGGGFLPATVSTVDRIDYSNDASAVLTRGPLSSARYSLAATGNSNFGYFAGGIITGPTVYSTVDRINYSNDLATASVRGSLSTTNLNMAATGTSNFGYFGGGRNLPVPADYSKIERIDYSNDNATALVRSQFLTARRLFAATGNSNFGYFGGGTAAISIVDRLDYSSDTTTASTRGPLSLGRRNFAATGTSNFGYFGGGTTGSLVSTVDRVDYSNDLATATIRGPLSSTRYSSAATSPTAFGGATDFTPTQTFFDIQSMRGIEDTTNYSVKKRALGSFGYFGGGSVPGPTAASRVDRVDYSNDTATASVRGPLSLAEQQLAATGNFNFGYYIGGFNPSSPSQVSTTQRIDYSNDSSIALSRGPLPSIEYRISATTSNNFAYTFRQLQTTIYRIDYSNDSASAISRGNRTTIREYLGATGNSNFGYYGGGFSPSPVPGGTNFSIVDRINYSNDNQTSLVRGPLSLVRRELAATGNSNFGYFGGGLPGPVSTVDRVNYSNDTTTASVRGPLSSVRYSSVATGNSNFGYFGGGSIGPVSTVDRIDYSNDTATASVRGPLSLARRYLAATTNARSS